MIAFIAGYQPFSVEFSSTNRRLNLEESLKPAIALTNPKTVLSPSTTSTLVWFIDSGSSAPKRCIVQIYLAN